MRDIVNSAAFERQRAGPLAVGGDDVPPEDSTEGASLRPAAYFSAVEATPPGGPSTTKIAVQKKNPIGKKPGIGSETPTGPALPTGTPSHHQPGMYQDATTGKTMAGNQLVRKPPIQADNNAQVNSDLKNPFVLAFLDLLSWTEGTTKYRWNTRHLKDPPLTDLSSFPYALKQPVGRYQIEPNTYDEIAVARLGLKDFSGHSQDMTAAMHLRLLKATDALLNGDLAGAIRAASGPWASVPVSAQENHSALPVMVNGRPKINPRQGAWSIS
jgi:muramidase (phage lysozyme)